jgi:hypothetical protein
MKFRRNTMRKMLLTGVLLALVAASSLHFAMATPAPDEGAFYRLWERTDAPVQNDSVERTWYWGPAPLTTLDEQYVEGYQGTRRVQYWDKGRMEISNPNENPANPWYVTAGLLSLELISGQLQVGDAQFDMRGRAQIPIAGDPLATNPNAPTYASFAAVTTVPANNHFTPSSEATGDYGLGGTGSVPRYGELVDETLDMYGNIGSNPDLATAHPGTRLVYYDPVLGHNIPVVFWDFLQRVGKVQINGEERLDVLVDWQYVMGHPVSEPYWVWTQVNHQDMNILVQVYERRVLTYNPNNPPGWEVEMGNIGQHYHTWRYGYVEPANTPAFQSQSTEDPDKSNWQGEVRIQN